MKRYVVWLIGFACLVVGFFIGRGKQIIYTEVRYEQGEKQTGHYGVSDLVPEHSELPGKVDLPTVPVVVWVEGKEVVVHRVDTVEIVRDYSVLYRYSKLLFDNENGKLTVNAGTQYNRLAYLDYDFTPVREVRTKVKERRWMPFVGVGYGTNGSVSVGAGVFWGRVGVECEWHRPLKTLESGWCEVGVRWRW